MSKGRTEICSSTGGERRNSPISIQCPPKAKVRPLILLIETHCQLVGDIFLGCLLIISFSRRELHRAALSLRARLQLIYTYSTASYVDSMGVVNSDERARVWKAGTHV